MLKHATMLGGTEPALPTADRWPLDKYQLLFVVNLVKLPSGSGLNESELGPKQIYAREHKLYYYITHRKTYLVDSVFPAPLSPEKKKKNSYKLTDNKI